MIFFNLGEKKGEESFEVISFPVNLVVQVRFTPRVCLTVCLSQGKERGERESFGNFTLFGRFNTLLDLSDCPNL